MAESPQPTHEVVIDITAKATITVPFTSVNYPDAETVQDAVWQEEGQDQAEMAEALVMQMSADEGVTLTWTVTHREVKSDG